MESRRVRRPRDATGEAPWTLLVFRYGIPVARARFLAAPATDRLRIAADLLVLDVGDEIVLSGLAAHATRVRARAVRTSRHECELAVDARDAHRLERLLSPLDDPRRPR